MKKSLLSKSNKRVAQKANPSNWPTDIIIDEIFDLTDKKFREETKIEMCKKELKQRGKDDIYAYYKQYIKRVLDGEIDFKRINPYHALNEVLKLNDAKKIWEFVNILEDLADENKLKLNYEKCSVALANTNDLEYNLYWAEVYKQANQANINCILKSKDAYYNARMVTLVENLSESEIAYAAKLVKASKNKEAKKELKETLSNKALLDL